MSCTNKGLDIFKHYLGGQLVNTNKQFKSPFYNDTKASCNIFLDKKSNLFKFKDFGENEPPLDAIGFACKYLNLSCQNSSEFVHALHLIDKALNLGIDKKNDAKPRRSNLQIINLTPEIASNQNNEALNGKITFKEFSKKELEYWNSYGIEIELLKSYNVRSVNSYVGFSQSGSTFTFISSDKEPIYAYQFNKFTKF